MIKVERIDDGFSLDGSLTFSTVTQALNQSLRFFNGAKTLLINLSNVKKSDSAGLALLCEWQRMAKSKHLQLNFSHAPEQLLNLARLTDAEKILNLES